MPVFLTPGTIEDMTAVGGSEVLVLDEFRLHTADTVGAAARIVSGVSNDKRDPVPLLSSIDDPRDVAVLRTVAAEAPDTEGPRRDPTLDRLVATWQPVRRYRPRIAERARGAVSSSFRLAVTESGINDEQVSPSSAWVGEPSAGEPVALLLIGVPEGTHAGLLVLVGRNDPDPAASVRDRTSWPLPLSRALGVRVYEGCQGPVAPERTGA